MVIDYPFCLHLSCRRLHRGNSAPQSLYKRSFVHVASHLSSSILPGLGLSSSFSHTVFLY